MLFRSLEGTAAGRPLNTLWREARVWGTAHQTVLQRNLGRFTETQVKQGLKQAALIDRMVKGLRAGDAWDELLQLTLKFARQPTGNPAGNAKGNVRANARGAAAPTH